MTAMRTLGNKLLAHMSAPRRALASMARPFPCWTEYLRETRDL